MELHATLDTLDGLDERFHELYTEKDGKFLLCKVTGVATDASVLRLTKALEAERKAHKESKEKWAKFNDLGPDGVAEKLALIDEGDDATDADGKPLPQVDTKKMTREIAQLQRQLQAAQKESEENRKKADELYGTIRNRNITDSVRDQAIKAGVIPSAIPDVLMLAERVFELSDDGAVLTRDSVGVTPGVDPAAWLSEVQSNRPHWWPSSESAGARGGSGGSGGKNPWSANHWNITEQAKYEAKHGSERAAALAAAAGSAIGAISPPARK